MSDLFQIVRAGTPSELERALLTEDVNIENEYGESLLHEAILSRKPEIALALIARGIKVNKVDHEAKTPLHLCAGKKMPEIARAILQSGGDVTFQDIHGNQPLWTAVFHARGEYGLVDLLLKAGGDPNHKNNSGKSPLDFAITIGDLELQKLLTRP